MFRIKNLLIILVTFFTFFLLISSVSASNFYVSDNTTHKDITNWMKKDAKKGDNLIFNTSYYDLSDTLTISKSVNIKSFKSTVIKFNKLESMFNVKINNVNFTGINLIHNYEGISNVYGISTILASQSYQLINFKNVNITGNMENVTLSSKLKKEAKKEKYIDLFHYSGIYIDMWKGNVTNCNIFANGELSNALSPSHWIGNIKNSNITSKGKETICVTLAWTWKGNLINSNIFANGFDSAAIHSPFWRGKMEKSKIYSCGNASYPYNTISPNAAIVSYRSKGQVSNCIIKSNNSHGIVASYNMKVNNCIISHKKGFKKIYRNKADLKINSVKKHENNYYITIKNIGDYQSKDCYLLLKTSTLTKKIKIHSMAESFGGPETYKIKIPKKYANKYYTKTIILDYYKQNKEHNKKNNIYKFKF